MRSIGIILTSYMVGCAYARQLASQGGALMWIATVDDAYDCETMRAHILSMEGRNLMQEDDAPRAMASHADCFISFTGSEEFAKFVNETEGIIDVDPDNEVWLDDVPWALDRIDGALDSVPYSAPFSGAGAHIYIIDTGILKTHTEFGDRVHEGANFVPDEDVGDFHGHGTFCASSAAGFTTGVAPGAILHSVKVLNSRGSGSTAGVIAGIQWAMDHARTNAWEPAILSLSLGGGRSTSMNKAAEDAARDNIVVVAAGNSGADAKDYSPASAKGDVITVGATSKSDLVASFSNFGPDVDVFAPGVSILGASIRGRDTFTTMSGTSMSTPIVAGIAAQALEANGFSYKESLRDLYDSVDQDVIKQPFPARTHNRLAKIIPARADHTRTPVAAPTPFPTRAVPLLCIKGHGHTCFEYFDSNFGPRVDGPDYYEAPLAVPLRDPTMCTVSTEDEAILGGKIALVKRGGCLFFDKVKNAENAGAQAVIIYNNVNSAPFSPNYYGDEEVNVPSCMISLKDGKELRKLSDTEIFWGILQGGTHAPTPSEEAIQCPDLNRRLCRREKLCRWVRKRRGKKCVQRHKRC